MTPPAALQRRLSRSVARAVRSFSLIADGDRVLVAVSGGKDSYCLLHLLDALSKRAPIDFELVPVHVDIGHPNHDPSSIVSSVKQAGFELHIEHDDGYAAVQRLTRDGKSPCSLCARFRRAVLYRVAREKGCKKVALGHHRDDVVTTFVLNLLFSGQLKAMPPKLVADAGDLIVIRPMLFCSEEDLSQLATERRFALLERKACELRSDSRRASVSSLLASFEQQNPAFRAHLMASLANVRPSHLLDIKLWQRLGIDAAFEEEM